MFSEVTLDQYLSSHRLGLALLKPEVIAILSQPLKKYIEKVTLGIERTCVWHDS